MAELRLSRIFSEGWPAIVDFGSRLVLPSEDPIAVYVCLCNALTDRQVKQAAASLGSTKPSSVYAACGGRAQCGQCAKALVALLRGEGCAMPESLPTD